MPDARIEAALSGSGIERKSAAWEGMIRYAALLSRWNDRVNLVSSTGPDVLVPLIQESLWAAGRYPTDFKVHLDIGSGGGFPAIPMAVILQDVEITMVESKERKAAFIQTVIHDLGLRNARVANQRLDEFLRRSPMPGPWDCVSWKAVRLRKRDFSRLLEAAAEDVRFWVFHGADLPIEDPTSFSDCLALNHHEECPYHSGWFLSDFSRRTVSRETG